MGEFHGKGKDPLQRLKYKNGIRWFLTPFLCRFKQRQLSSSVVVAAQRFDELVGGGLHVDEVVAERAGAVEHQHDHGALVFVDYLGVARRSKLAIVLPLLVLLHPTPLFYIIGGHFDAIAVDEVLESKHVEDTL